MRRLGRFAHRLAFAVVLLLGAGALAADEVRLAPGQPLDRAVAQALLGPAAAATAGIKAARLVVDEPALPLANPYDETATLSVERLEVAAGDRFHAVVAIRVGTHAPLHLTLSGELRRLVALPTPRTAIAEGTRLRADDFEVLELPLSRVRGEWVRDRAGLEGLEARRRLLAGQPVDADAIGPPRLVRRGEPVRLVYAAAGMRLEASGVARDDGVLGAFVEIRNDRSGTVVGGVVTGPGEVQVEAR